MNSLSLFPRDAIQALLMSVKTISKILLKLNGEKKMRKRQDLCNCCDHKFTSLTRLKAHIEVVHVVKNLASFNDQNKKVESSAEIYRDQSLV